MFQMTAVKAMVGVRSASLDSGFLLDVGAEPAEIALAAGADAGEQQVGASRRREGLAQDGDAEARKLEHELVGVVLHQVDAGGAELEHALDLEGEIGAARALQHEA